ncbi:MAG TPA: NADH:flavin oxidoreductase [Kofleriaceae bacterium]|nr:NADH:flavin oxidoreductase [Kofleriaceae bacterium]
MLHRPLTLRCGLVLPNRVALAPLTNLQSHADGLLGDDELAFLARRADGGFGLVETCAAYVALDGKAWPGELGVDRDACVPGLTRLAARLHEGGAPCMVQLFHGGVRADRELTGELPWSASTWTEDGPTFVAPRPATLDDLTRVIGQFADAAARAEAAGFDGVELHGAHGYLLSQFLSRTMNPRDDGWGGDLPGRARLTREVMRACRRRCSPRFAIGVRLSLEDFGNARGMDLDDNLQVARWLAEDGADFIHASLWDVTKRSTKYPDRHPVTMLREALPRDVAVLACGKIWTHADAEAVLDQGADVIAVGRAGILNPDWPRATEIKQPPITAAELRERAVSPRFADYLRRWKNFVAD